jgi:hypothetical protein
MSEKTTKADRNVVFWSGGIDSTVLLHRLATYSSRSMPVRAITIAGHININEYQLMAQNKAQENYLEFAKSEGFHINHVKIKIEGEYDAKYTSQLQIWLCHIFPYLYKNDTVNFSYIRRDDFWHFKRQYCNVFDSLIKLKGGDVYYRFPFAWYHKEDVIQELEVFKIPKNCWFVCEGVKEDLEPCGECLKCTEAKRGFEIYEDLRHMGLLKTRNRWIADLWPAEYMWS